MKQDLTKFKDEILFCPLGGTDEIGVNCYLYHYKGKWLIVDLGIGFADESYPGVDLLVPDISFLQSVKSNIVGLVVTHAHEDHLGAVAYLWRELQVPVYTTKFTAAVLQSKLADAGLKDKVKIHEIKENSTFSVKPFDLEFIGLTHSIPEMQSLLIKTDKGNVFHSGDWKLDPDPVVGQKSNEKRLREIGNEGVLAMICDSTNVFVEGHSGSEGELRKSLTDLIASFKKQMVVVTTFASNIARVYSIAKAAEKSGRKVALAGTSLWRMYHAAVSSGYISDAPEFLKPSQIRNYPREDIVVIATGCQGEINATMRKLSRDDHPDFKLAQGDVVIFASKIIPGNEEKIFHLFNQFCKKKVDVLTEKDHFVHVSGHPAKQELAKMYEMVKPQIAIPVHGEPMHIHEHCSFAKKLGVKQTVQVEDGMVVRITADEPGIVGKVPTGKMAIDGNFILAGDSEILKMRRTMRDDGAVFATIIIDKKGKLLKQPLIIAPGVLDSNEDSEYYDMLTEEVREFVQSHNKYSDGDIENRVRSIIKRFMRSEAGKFPRIFVFVQRTAI
jgi:ribonuclease J